MNSSGIPCMPVVVQGRFINDSNTSQGLGNLPVNATVFGQNNWNNTTTNGTGYFSMNVTLPCGDAEFNMSINGNGTVTKAIEFTSSDALIIESAFVNAMPPFQKGSSFLLELTLKNDTGAPLVNKSAPVLELFKENSGPTTSITSVNMSNQTNSSGSVRYNLTIAADAASGIYIIRVNNRYSRAFMVSSALILVGKPEDNEGSVRPEFGAGNNVSIVVLVRNNNTLNDSATVTAVVIAPGGNNTNVTLYYDSANSQYVGNYTPSNTTSGDYSVKISGTLGSETASSFVSFSVSSYRISLVPETGIFEEFGKKKAITPGGQVRLALAVFNNTNDELISNSVVNCTTLTLVNVVNTGNGSSYNSTVASSFNTSTTALYGGTPTCRVMFDAPTNAGLYAITVKLTFDGIEKETTSFFRVQNFLLNVVPTSDIGVADVMAFSPSTNITFTLSAYNLSSRSALSGTLLQDIAGVSLMPLMMSAGSNFTAPTVTNTTYGVSSPTITIEVPVTTGPYILTVRANASGELIDGEAFFLTKYVEGFLVAGGMSAMMGGGSGGPGDEGEGPGAMGGMGVSKCNGSQVFGGQVMDIKTFQGVSGVQLVGISEARAESTGKDVSSCMDLTTPGVSLASGSINATITFNGTRCDLNTLSGFHFIIFNVTVNGSQDFLPGGFQCKRMMFFPSVSAIQTGGQQNQGGNNYRISPTGAINVTVTSASILRNGQYINGTMNVTQIMSFDPATGTENRYLPTIAGQSNTTMVLGNASLNFTPAVFGLTRWPNGFKEIIVTVCDNTTGTTCDTERSGFEVVSFDAFTQMSFFGGMPQYAIGDAVSLNISARTNVSNFTIKVGRPFGGGGMVDVTTVAYLVDDGWNGSGQWGSELWTVNFTVPTSAQKGFNQVIITVTSNASGTEGDILQVFYPLTVAKFSVSLLQEEGLMMDSYRQISQDTWGVLLQCPFDGNTFCPVGTTQGMVANNTTYKSALFGSGIYINDSNTDAALNLSVNNSTVVNFNGQMGSVHLRIKADWNGTETLGPNRTIIDIVNASETAEYKLWKNGIYLNFSVRSATGTASIISNISAWSANSVHYVVTSWSPGWMELYIDGRHVGGTQSNNGVTNAFASGRIYLGSNYTLGEKLNATLDELRITQWPAGPFDVSNTNSSGSAYPSMDSYYGWNLTGLNVTNALASKSGSICLKTGLNTSVFNEMGYSSGTNVYRNGSYVLAIDNATTGKYDTLVFRNLSGTNAVDRIINENDLNKTIIANVFLWEVKDCGYSKIANSTASVSATMNNWGGEHVMGEVFDVPMRIRKGTTNIQGMMLDAKRFVKQASTGNDMGGGMGFEGTLSTSQFSKMTGITDNNGFAFLRLNFSTNGFFRMAWNISNGTSSDEASFDQGVWFVVRAFDTQMTKLSGAAYSRMFNLTRSTPAYNRFAVGYTGSYNESAGGVLVPDGIGSVFYVAYDNESNAISVDDDSVFGLQRPIGMVGLTNQTGDNATFQFGPDNTAFDVPKSVGMRLQVFGANSSWCSNYGPAQGSTISIVGTNSTGGSFTVTQHVTPAMVNNQQITLSPLFTNITRVYANNSLNNSQGACFDGVELTAGAQNETNYTMQDCTENGIEVTCLSRMQLSLNSYAGEGGPGGGEPRNLEVNALNLNGDGTGGNITLAFVNNSNSGNMGMTFINSSLASTYNMTVRVCAMTFDNPARGINNVSVNFTAQLFSPYGPPRTIALNSTDVASGVTSTLQYTGPSGCTISTILPPGQWPNGFTDIKAIMSNGSVSEIGFVSSVFQNGN